MNRCQVSGAGYQAPRVKREAPERTPELVLKPDT